MKTTRLQFRPNTPGHDLTGVPASTVYRLAATEIALATMAGRPHRESVGHRDNIVVRFSGGADQDTVTLDAPGVGPGGDHRCDCCGRKEPSNRSVDYDLPDGGREAQTLCWSCEPRNL